MNRELLGRMLKANLLDRSRSTPVPNLPTDSHRKQAYPHQSFGQRFRYATVATQITQWNEWAGNPRLAEIVDSSGCADSCAHNVFVRGGDDGEEVISVTDGSRESGRCFRTAHRIDCV